MKDFRFEDYDFIVRDEPAELPVEGTNNWTVLGPVLVGLFVLVGVAFGVFVAVRGGSVALAWLAEWHIINPPAPGEVSIDAVRVTLVDMLAALAPFIAIALGIGIGARIVATVKDWIQ